MSKDTYVPVVVNSHIAWSNTTSPFWTTLFFVGVAETVRRDKPPLLILDAVLAGLALQTHPSVIVFVLGAAVWLAVMRPTWLRTRWPWLALLVGAMPSQARSIWRRLMSAPRRPVISRSITGCTTFVPVWPKRLRNDIPQHKTD